MVRRDEEGGRAFVQRWPLALDSVRNDSVEFLERFYNIFSSVPYLLSVCLDIASLLWLSMTCPFPASKMVFCIPRSLHMLP